MLFKNLTVLKQQTLQMIPTSIQSIQPVSRANATKTSLPLIESKNLRALASGNFTYSKS